MQDELSGSATLAQVEMARFLVKLGYDACAFNVTAIAPLGRQHRCDCNPNAPLPPPPAKRWTRGDMSGPVQENEARGRILFRLSRKS
jgi:hypothetical protein